jgi:hypothetical protein
LYSADAGKPYLEGALRNKLPQLELPQLRFLYEDAVPGNNGRESPATQEMAVDTMNVFRHVICF